MKKKKFKFSHLYLGLVMAITYLPLIMVVIFSMNTIPRMISGTMIGAVERYSIIPLLL